jgi:hypothetical protein
MSQKPKFIQITSSSTNIQAHNYAGVHAIDENGNVWFFQPNSRKRRLGPFIQRAKIAA